MEQRDSRLQQRLVEGENHKDLLDVHLDDGLADERGPEEGPEGDEEMTAGDTGQVEQGIGNGGAEEDAEEAGPLHQHLDAVFPALVAGHGGGVLELLLLQGQELLLLLPRLRTWGDKKGRKKLTTRLMNIHQSSTLKQLWIEIQTGF